MAWIESHETLANHPKTKRLARLLNDSIPAVIGRLHLLWWWAMSYAEDGDLSRYVNDDIADAVMWQGASEEVVEALIQAGFIDKDGNSLVIHDWTQYAGRLLDKRKQNAERMRNARATNVQRTCETRVGLPNLTVPNKEIKDIVQYTSEFEEFWKVYPNKKGKQAAFKCWEKRLKECSHTELMTAAQGYAKECVKENRESRFIMHAQTFLGPQRRYEDYLNTEKVTETPPPVVKRHIEDEEALDKAYESVFGNKRIH